MNSNLGKPNNQQKGSVSLNNFEFDFNLGSNFSTNRSQPLKDQKQQTSPFSSSSSYSSAQPRPVSSSTSWTSNKPSWTHQPAPSQSIRPGTLNPTSMIGDISGKSWNSSTPSSSTVGIGIVEKNPNLFGDLLGSALGQSKNNSNVPLKNVAPVSVAPTVKNNSYSMGNLANSLPNTGVPSKSSNWGSGGENLGSYSSVNNSKNVNLGGPSMRSGTSGAAKKDPFVSLVDFGSKKEPGVKINNAKSSNVSSSDEHLFGDFQNAGKSSSSPSNNNSMGSNSVPSSKKDNFGVFDIPIQDFGSKQQPPSQAKGTDPLDMLFSSSSGSASAGPVQSDVTASEQFSEMADWDLGGTGFGGDDTGGTTELEGLPPPPAGVTASTAKNKGLDNYKQGQHADAIKWLSWAVVLLEKAGDSATTMEVLSSRASCYKEVGEYKKAIADCTKVLEQDGANVSVLLQRALLYESTEKYKLGAEDLRAVMKIDPGNRLARSTIHRLLQLAE